MQMKKLFSLLVVLLTTQIGFAQHLTDTIRLSDVTISTSRFSQVPITNTSVMVDSVMLMAQETPQVLAKLTPSVYSQTDNGTPFGYSYLTIRGMNCSYGQNRVLYSMNGVPLNEGENSHLFTSNFTDLLSNTSSFEFSRGASISSSGSASFVGGLEMISKSPFGQKSGEVSGMYGSFNSFRGSIAYTTGEVAPGFGATFRISTTGSDGYRRDSYGNSQSMYSSFGYRKGNHVLKFNSFVGVTRNGQSWIPVPEGADPRTNVLTDTLFMGLPVQPDHFVNSFNQLQYSYYIGEGWTFNLSPYILTNNGNFDLPGDKLNNTNLALKSIKGGGYFNTKYSGEHANFIFGGDGNYFHVNNLFTQRPNAELIFDNNTSKMDVNMYSRTSFLIIENVRVSADIQWRRVKSDFISSGISNNLYAFDFFNYSVGADFPFTVKSTKFDPYITYTKVSREPTKTNMNIFSDIANINRLSPEVNHDLEFGMRIHNEIASIKVNGFYMNMENEMLPTGVVDVTSGTFTGYQTAKSIRYGLEIESDLKWKNLHGGVNFAYIHTKNALLSPKEILTVHQGISFKGFSTNLSYQFVSESLLDVATSTKLPAVHLLNLDLSYTYKAATFEILVYNLTNKNQTLSGAYDGKRNFYYSSGTATYGSLKLKF